MELSIVGRSSSHFTRVARIFAHELNVEHAFVPVADLGSRDVGQYAGNPALKIPVLQTPEGPWFGALNVSRELARRAAPAQRILWPEQLQDRMAANAHELIVQGMSTEVSLIMQGAIDPSSKPFESLVNSLRWLEEKLPGVVTSVAKPDTLSTLEVMAYCFVTHLAFRSVLDVSPYRSLLEFCDAFGRRASAQATAYRFDFS